MHALCTWKLRPFPQLPEIVARRAKALLLQVLLVALISSTARAQWTLQGLTEGQVLNPGEELHLNVLPPTGLTFVAAQVNWHFADQNGTVLVEGVDIRKVVPSGSTLDLDVLLAPRFAT